MNKRLVRFSVLVVFVALAAMLVMSATAAARKGKGPPPLPPADTVYVNGQVLTYGEDRWQSAVVVDDGIIKYVGHDTQARRYVGADTELVDLHGRMMMPGLQDAHTHLRGYVMCDMGYEGGTVDYILAKLKAALLRDDQIGMLHSNYLLTASYFNSQSVLPPGTHLDRYMLDRLSKDPSEDPMGTGTTRPIRVTDLDGHTYIVNSKAIQNSGVTKDTPDPPDGTIGRDANGEPNGFFADYSPPAPFGLTAPTPPNATYLGWRDVIQEYNRKGTTSIMRAGGGASQLAMLKQLADNGFLTVRASLAVSAGWVRGEDDPEVLADRIAGIDLLAAQYDGYASPNSPGAVAVNTVKVFADGVVEYPSQTAAMLLPYNVNVGTEENPIWVPGPSRGEEPSVSDATLGFVMLDADGWSIHVHAIGDRAVRETLDNCEAAQMANGVRDSRHSMVHVELVDPADMPRFGALGVIANMQLQWAERDTYTVDGMEGYLNPEVMATIYPARSILKGGGVLAGGSDFPVDPLNPFNQIELAVTREQTPNELMGVYEGPLNYKERLSLMQSLVMHTWGAAYQMHQDDMTGSIEVGKYADLIVLDENLFQIPVGQISDAKVLLTTVGGQVVWEDPATPLRHAR